MFVRLITPSYIAIIKEVTGRFIQLTVTLLTVLDSFKTNISQYMKTNGLSGKKVIVTKQRNNLKKHKKVLVSDKALKELNEKRPLKRWAEAKEGPLNLC